jgi:hypothetical protein
MKCVSGLQKCCFEAACCARQKAGAEQQNLIAFLFRDAESTHSLTEFRKSQPAE